MTSAEAARASRERLTHSPKLNQSRGEPPARPTVPEVRSHIPIAVSAKSLPIGLAVFAGAMILYIAAVAAMLLAPWWPLQIACAILTGLFLATVFVVGHDACHGSLTPYDRLNAVLGRLAFLPTWTPYASWQFAHNRVHHSYTNLRGKDYAWAPLSKAEYDGSTRVRRWLERHYRSIWGLGSYYLFAYWLRHLIFPSAQEREEMQRPFAFPLDLVLVSAFAAAQMVGLYAWSTTLVPDAGPWGAFKSFPALLSTVIVLPFLIWNWGMGFAIFQHHNHPRAVWYGLREEWDFFAGQVESTVHAKMPRWLDWTSAFIMQHTAHHVNKAIPLYRLAESQLCLERAYGDQIIVQPWSFTALGKTLARCQLYDYENHRWLNFNGRQTMGPNPMMREFKLQGHVRGPRRVTSGARKNVVSPAALSSVRTSEPARVSPSIAD